MFIALMAMSLVVGSIFAVYAVSQFSQSSSIAVSIKAGGNLMVLSGQISNGTLTNPCSFSNGTWFCSIATIKQGYNLTTTLLVENTGTGVQAAYTNSTAVKGASQGILVNQYTKAMPFLVNPAQKVNVSVIFEVFANATVGATIQINSTLF